VYVTISTIQRLESPGPIPRRVQLLRIYPALGDALNVVCLPSSSHPSKVG